MRSLPAMQKYTAGKASGSTNVRTAAAYAFEPASSFVNHLATVWWTDDGVGTARLSAVAATTSFRTLSLVFSLDFGDSAILDPADVDVTIEGAWSQTGSPVATSVSSKTIF